MTNLAQAHFVRQKGERGGAKNVRLTRERKRSCSNLNQKEKSEFSVG